MIRGGERGFARGGAKHVALKWRGVAARHRQIVRIEAQRAADAVVVEKAIRKVEGVGRCPRHGNFGGPARTASLRCGSADMSNPKLAGGGAARHPACAPKKSATDRALAN